MNDKVILLHLRDFITWAQKHQELDRQHRMAWRYQHKREEIKPKRAEAFRNTERAYTEMRAACGHIKEPTYYTRTARELIESWDRYRANTNIMIAEYNTKNRQIADSSRATFELLLKTIAEKIKKAH